MKHSEGNISIENNQYDSKGWGMLPEVEIKCIEVILPPEEFLRILCDVLSIPISLRNTFLLVFKYRDKAGVFNIVEYNGKEMKKSLLRKNLTLLGQTEFLGLPIISCDYKGNWRINKHFLYNFFKDWELNIKYKVITDDSERV